MAYNERGGEAVKVHDAHGKVCPFMSGVGQYSTSTGSTQQYYGGTGGPVVNIPGPPSISSSLITTYCKATMCMAWVGDTLSGRCGLVTQITDAEVMAMNLKQGEVE